VSPRRATLSRNDVAPTPAPRRVRRAVDGRLDELPHGGAVAGLRGHAARAAPPRPGLARARVSRSLWRRARRGAAATRARHSSRARRDAAGAGAARAKTTEARREAAAWDAARRTSLDFFFFARVFGSPFMVASPTASPFIAPRARRAPLTPRRAPG